MSTSTTLIYTLSLHDALPISFTNVLAVSTMSSMMTQLRPFTSPITFITSDTFGCGRRLSMIARSDSRRNCVIIDRKSTRLNSSHRCISYAVFCLKKKKNTHQADHKTRYLPNRHYLPGTDPFNQYPLDERRICTVLGSDQQYHYTLYHRPLRYNAQ